MKLDRRELITLRVSLARIAQAAGICPATFGSLTIEPDDGYWALHRKAIACDRGWNRLALEVTDRLRILGGAASGHPVKNAHRRTDGAYDGDDEADES